MKSRSGLLALLVAGVGLFAAIAVGWKVRADYERDLIRRIWPTDIVGRVAPVADNTSPTVLLLGDSRMREWDLTTSGRERFLNAGVNGATTAEVLASIGEILRRYRPKVVVIEAGINDLKLLGLRPDLREKVVATVRANLAAILEQSRLAGCKVVLLTVWPPGEPDLVRRLFTWNCVVPEAVEEVNRALLADQPRPGVEVVDLFAAGSVRPTYRDTLHFTPGTYRELAPGLEARLESLLARP